MDIYVLGTTVFCFEIIGSVRCLFQRAEWFSTLVSVKYLIYTFKRTECFSTLYHFKEQNFA